jgi:hypothetical protein
MSSPKTVKFQARNGKTAECGKCRKPIAKGDRYTFAHQGFRGAKLVRCTDYACAFKRSEYTSSKLAGVYAASEEGHDRIDGLTATDLASIREDLETILSEVADAWREVAQEYEDAADAMGEGFGDQMTEKAEEINSAADALESESVDVDEHDGCEKHTEATEPATDCEDCSSLEAEVINAARDQAREAIDNAESEIG